MEHCWNVTFISALLINEMLQWNTDVTDEIRIEVRLKLTRTLMTKMKFAFKQLSFAPQQKKQTSICSFEGFGEERRGAQMVQASSAHSSYMRSIRNQKKNVRAT